MSAYPRSRRSSGPPISGRSTAEDSTTGGGYASPAQGKDIACTVGLRPLRSLGDAVPYPLHAGTRRRPALRAVLHLRSAVSSGVEDAHRPGHEHDAAQAGGAVLLEAGPDRGGVADGGEAGEGLG